MGDYEWMSTWINRNMLCELYIKHKVLGDAQYIFFDLKLHNPLWSMKWTLAHAQ